MPRETIAAIREAELAAERIRAEAAKKSSQMIADEKKAGEALLVQAKAETEAEINENFKALSDAAAKLIEKNTAEAEREARDIKNHAKLRMRGAINEIFRGLSRQCQ